MENKISQYLPTRSLIFLGICCAGILGFFLLEIYPNYKQIGNLDTQVSLTETQIEEQGILTPLYRQMREFQTASAKTEKAALPDQASPTLPGGGDVNYVMSLMKGIAKEVELTTERIEPDVASMLDDSGRVKMMIALAGDYGNFREFMLLMNRRVPTIESVESLQIQRAPESTDHRLAMAIWLNQGTGK